MATPKAAPVSGPEFEAALNQYEKDLVNRGLASGPRFTGRAGSPPQRWHDQVFERNINPAGQVACPRALRVGATNNSLDVILYASHGNAGELTIPAGSTITANFLVSDAPDGTFEAVGPTVCVTAPAGGLTAAPDDLVCRFPLGNFEKPWLMVNLEFTGAIAGGTVDCGLWYMPR